VRIDSPSGFERHAARYCERALLAAGCTVRFDDSAKVTGSDTGNLIAEMRGNVPGMLVLSAHLDCVEPCRGVEPEVVDGRVVSKGETVLGADDKSGVAAAIECVRALSDFDGPLPTIRCIFTVQEEIGLAGAKALQPDDLGGDLCLVLDADGAPGGIVVGAPTHYTFASRFIGRAAHAGLRPETGVSALRMAADAITKMPIGRIDEITTANVGTIHGGSATNVITAEVNVTGECRSLDRDRVEALREEMDRAMRDAAASLGGDVEVVWRLEYEGFTRDEHSEAVRLVAEACADAGVSPRPFTTGGGSDANVLAAKGMTTVALSCGMDGVHGTDESITVSDLEALARLCVAVARRMGARAV